MNVEGLTSLEAQTRLNIFGANSLPGEARQNFLSISFSVVREPMLILLILAGAISFLIADLADAILLGITVFIVLGISIYQRQRTEKAIHALRNLTAPLALVMRDGKRTRISSLEVVPGDILLLQEGDRVPADAHLLSESSLEFDESTLTGESIPITKSHGEPVFTGSLIVRGTGEAEVSRTGVSTELGRIGKSLQEIPYQRTQLQDSIDRLVKGVGALAFVAVITIVVVYGLTRGSWLEGALAAIAAAMALIPEEFPVILTLFMALGAWRMAKTRVIARQPAAIEALGSITVLCVDKTGTLTKNEMQIDEFQIDGTHFVVRDGDLPSEFAEIARMGALATPIHPFDAMDQAFRTSAGMQVLAASLKSVREFPLTKKRLAYIHVWQEGETIFAAAKGAPEHIGDLCGLEEIELKRLLEKVHEAAERGYRIIAVAKGTASRSLLQGEISDQILEEITLEDFTFNFMGLALLHDPIRDGVPDAVAECKSAGIRTIMITGDHPTTAKAIAREIGIADHGRCIVGNALIAMSDVELSDALKECSVFARVSPEEKLLLVKGFQKLGEVVAMTGDGVNDAPALRAAEIGIAMGGRGTDVAREAAHLVITDDNFTSIVAGIKRGRAIFANIQKAMSYVIAIHIPIFGMAIVPIFIADWPIILLPALVAFHEVIIDPACSIVFEVEEPDPRIMKNKPKKAKSGIFQKADIALALSQGFSVFLSVFGVFLYSLHQGFSEEVTRSLTFGSLLFANVLLILSNRSRTLTVWQSITTRRNIAVPWITIGALSLLALLLNLPVLREAFNLGVVRLVDYCVMACSAYLGIAWFEIYKFVRKRKSGL